MVSHCNWHLDSIHNLSILSSLALFLLVESNKFSYTPRIENHTFLEYKILPIIERVHGTTSRSTLELFRSPMLARRCTRYRSVSSGRTLGPASQTYRQTTLRRVCCIDWLSTATCGGSGACHTGSTTQARHTLTQANDERARIVCVVGRLSVTIILRVNYTITIDCFHHWTGRPVTALTFHLFTLFAVPHRTYTPSSDTHEMARTRPAAVAADNEQ